MVSHCNTALRSVAFTCSRSTVVQSVQRSLVPFKQQQTHQPYNSCKHIHIKRNHALSLFTRKLSSVRTSSGSTAATVTALSDPIVRVHAYYVTPHLDLTLLQQFYTHTQQYNKPDCLLITLPSNGNTQLSNAVQQYDTQQSYVIVYQYGSVVFFNCTESQQQDIIQQLLKLNTTSAQQSQQTTATPLNKDSYAIRIDSTVRQAQITNDGITIRQLDISGARIIGLVLAQTVGMQQYEATAEQLMSQFRLLNQQLIQRGAVRLDDKQLFKLVAQTSGVMGDVLVQLRLLDRSDLAWSSGELDQLLQGLKADFEIQNRFDALEIKLNLMQQSTTFLLEVLHNQKSNKLEWIIIILILAEVFISLYELPHIISIPFT